MGKVTLDVGVRYDRQWGEALAANNKANSAFPDLVPGIEFPGYEAPFHWNNISPRVGMTYALDESQKTILRASASRNAGQLTAVGTYIGYANPSSGAGWVDYPWVDANNDHLAQTSEVQVNRPILASGGGFNTANPTAVTSANQIDPDFSAPINFGVILGFDRELAPNLAITLNYTYNQVSNIPMTRFIGLTTADWAPAAPLVGTTPDGVSYNIPLFIPDAAKVAAVGGSRILTNFEDYKTTFSGIEVSMNKRMSNRWMSRVAFAWNTPQEQYDMDVPVDDFGNPTRTDVFPLISGGQWAPRSGGSGSGDVFVNQRWNFNANGAYQMGWDMELAANLFASQARRIPTFVTRRWAARARCACC